MVTRSGNIVGQMTEQSMLNLKGPCLELIVAPSYERISSREELKDEGSAVNMAIGEEMLI